MYLSVQELTVDVAVTNIIYRDVRKNLILRKTYLFLQRCLTLFNKIVSYHQLPEYNDNKKKIYS